MRFLTAVIVAGFPYAAINESFTTEWRTFFLGEDEVTESSAWIWPENRKNYETKDICFWYHS